MKTTIASLSLCVAAALLLAAPACCSKDDEPAWQRTLLGRLSSRTDDEVFLRRAHPRVHTSSPTQTPACTLSVDPSVLPDGADPLVYYTFAQGTSGPQDYITVSCGPTNGPDDYLDRRTVSNTTQSPVQFANLIAMRCNYTFTYVSVSGSTHTALCSTTVPMADSPNAPKQVHIAFGDDPEGMLVTFVSASTNTPQVRYGPEPDVLTSTANGTSITYSASEMCDSPANTTSQVTFRNPGYIHTVALSNLFPGQRYYYQVGNDADGWSQVFSFKARKPAGASSTSFIAYADMGLAAPPAAFTTAQLVNEEIDGGIYDDFLLHFGDISYARGTAWMWDAFFRLIEPYAARTPYMVSIGNHEYDHEHGGQNDPSGAPGEGFHPVWGNMGSDSSGECAVPIVKRFRAPSNGEGIFWYSFNYGPVHVLQMSTEHDWTQGSEQYQWVEQDLKSVNRSITPWVVVTGHRMMYTTQERENADYIVSTHFRQEMDPLFHQYKVNLMLVGHQHSYERSCPVYMGNCIPSGEGTTHIVVGSAGAGLETGGFSPIYGNFSVRHINDWGYCRIQATMDTFQIQFVKNDEDNVWDEVSLVPWW